MLIGHPRSFSILWLMATILLIIPPLRSYSQSTPPGVSIVQVDSLIGPNEISTGRLVTFHLNYHNYHSFSILAGATAICIYSPEGATWTTSTGQHTGLLTPYWDQVFATPYNIDGMNADTIGFAGFAQSTQGIPPSFEGVPFTLTIGPIPDIYDGCHICIDSSRLPTGLEWHWMTGDYEEIPPPWYGPYCYTIRLPANRILTSPDTLLFYDLSDAYDPSARNLRIFAPDSGAYQFTASENVSWLSLSKTSGTTPEYTLVSVDPSGLSPGAHYADISISAPGTHNGTCTAVVKLVVLDIPSDDAAIVLDHAVGLDSRGRIRPDVPVTFYLRLVNNTLAHITGLTNGFSVWSPDGAQWGSTTADTLGIVGLTAFDAGFFINYFDADGSGVDTVGYGGLSYVAKGLAPGFNQIGYSITIGPIDPSFADRTICLDTCFYAPSGYWIWSDSDGTIIPPFWAGPICFSIAPSDIPIRHDSLLLPSQTVPAGVAVQPVVLKLTDQVQAAMIPLRIPDGVTVTDLSLFNLITEKWSNVLLEIKPDSGFIFISLADTLGEVIPAGETRVCDIYFAADNISCEQGLTISWDTTLSDDPARSLRFIANESLIFQPEFDIFRDHVEIAPLMPGDCNGDGTNSVADLTYLIAYLFRGGPPPPLLLAANVDGQGGITVADLTFLIAYLFRGGPAPTC